MCAWRRRRRRKKKRKETNYLYVVDIVQCSTNLCSSFFIFIGKKNKIKEENSREEWMCADLQTKRESENRKEWKNRIRPHRQRVLTEILLSQKCMQFPFIIHSQHPLSLTTVFKPNTQFDSFVLWFFGFALNFFEIVFESEYEPNWTTITYTNIQRVLFMVLEHYEHISKFKIHLKTVRL